MRFLAVPALALMALTTTPAAAIECERKGDLCVIKWHCPANHIHFEGKCWTNQSYQVLPPAIYDKPFTGDLVENYAESIEEIVRECGVKALACTRRLLYADGSTRACTILYAPAWR